MRNCSLFVVLAALCCAIEPASAAPVVFNPDATAFFSQGGFDVDFVIDANLDPASGWANHNGVTSNGNNIGVFETAAPTAAGAYTNLTFNISSGNYGTHTLGRFRISATTDSNASYGNGPTNGGNVTANWIPLDPITFSSTGPTTTLTRLGDLSILASGAPSELETYTINAQAPLSGITGFRIEALTDPSLPFDSALPPAQQVHGPGRGFNGNFVVSNLSVDTTSAAANGVQLINGTAQRSQGGFSVDNMIDGVLPTNDAGGVGWANNVEGNNIATMATLANTPTGPATELTFKMFAGGFPSHTLGKFRLSATTANRSLFADGNDNGGAGVGNEAIWTVLDPSLMTSDVPGTTFLENPDHSILVGGSGANLETYTIKATTSLSGITGFRLEALTDPSLPTNNVASGGPGRAFNGNFVVRELTVEASIVPEPSTIALALSAGLGLASWRLRRRPAQQPV